MRPSYVINCQVCGKETIAHSRRAKYCTDCRDDVIKQRRKLLWHKQSAKKSCTHTATVSIAQILSELKKYNRQNGTYLTYGQYVSLSEKCRGGKTDEL